MGHASDLASDLLTETRDEIHRADSKANILLAVAGLAASVLIGGLVSSDLSLTGARGAVQVLTSLACAALALGISFLGAAVYPRTGEAAPGRVRYFRDVTQYKTVQELRAAVEDEAQISNERTLQQLLALSAVVMKKYRHTIQGEVAIGLSLAFAIAAAVGHNYLGR